jgi:hypothetical protein
MSFRCARCGKQVDALVPLDGLKYHYNGPLTRACQTCCDSMITAGDLVPSGTAERVVRAKRASGQITDEIKEVRSKQWLVRIGIAIVACAAGFWAWRRFG